MCGSGFFLLSLFMGVGGRVCGVKCRVMCMYIARLGRWGRARAISSSTHWRLFCVGYKSPLCLSVVVLPLVPDRRS